MSQAVSEHRAAAPDSLILAVMTVSDTRTLANDTSGALIVSMAEAAGHRIADRVIVPDEPERMTPLLRGLRRARGPACGLDHGRNGDQSTRPDV